MARRLHALPVIDLTQSDNEDSSFCRTPQLQPLAFLVSDHEPILPEMFGFTQAGSRETIHNGSYGNSITTHGTVQCLQGNRSARRSPASIRPPTNTAATLSRQSAEQSFARTSGVGKGRPDLAEGNASKRRKTCGEMVERESQIAALTHSRVTGGTSAPILPPANSSARRSGQPQIEGLAAAAETRGRITTPCATISAPDQNDGSTKHNMPMTARLQAGKAHISLDSSIQKPQNLLKDQKDRMDHNFCRQVVEYIKSALSKYGQILSIDDQDKIATRTSTKLVDDMSFYENFALNNGRLSAKHDVKLSTRTQAYVGEYASEILNSIRLESTGCAKKDQSQSNPPNLKTLPTTGNRMESLMTPSSCSDNDEEVFEALSDPADKKSLQPSNQISRCYSSSPTTSFSNDVYESAMDLDHHDDLKASPTVHKRRSLRHLGARSSKLETLPHRNVDHQGLASRLKQIRCLQDEKSNATFREVQSLRLAAGDKNAHRPYVSFKDREDIRHGCEILNNYPEGILTKSEQDLLQQSVFHVDFALEELEFLCKVIQAVKKDLRPLSFDLRSKVVALMSGQEIIIPTIMSILQKAVKMPTGDVGQCLVQKRSTAAIEAFLNDAIQGKISHVPQLNRIELAPRRTKTPAKPSILSLLRQREIYGLTPVRVRRGQQSFNVEITDHFEDTLARKSEWSDCCGDISTVSWTGEGTFICGATSHSDNHNMQYNKPGNLAVGSSSLDTLRAVADHRIVRPVIGRSDNTENALEAMRQTQDPWLYTSVVSTSHGKISGFSFTASFDHTVKVWKVSQNGSSMDIRGTWKHDGKVNFVVTSDYHEGVATASDVSNDAIRVYNFDKKDITNTPYNTYCGDKAKEQAQELQRRDIWAYFPATIQWGKSSGVANLLLVGYSPRSVTAYETDIPEDKKNSGELCLWDVKTGTRVPISSARTQNVFEVIWHPTQPCFLAATSPCGVFEPETKTQIRLFAQNETGSFLHIKALDCVASDINELTIMPNSSISCYVTASCTDGNTYVWDTAQGDRPIHSLGHGESLDNPVHDLPREIADTGVKYASWGKTLDRFYTGSSDGKVKAWNIRKPRGHAFVRTVLSVSGGISAGAFSKNFTKMLIGDSTGKVHLLEIDDNDPDSSGQVSGSAKTSTCHPPIPVKGPKVAIPSQEPGPANKSHSGSGILPEDHKRPKVLIPHPSPPPPAEFRLQMEEDEMTAQNIAHYYLEHGQLRMHPDPYIGAVQGPNYSETLLFNLEAHEGNDSTLPLLPPWQAKQRYEVYSQEEQPAVPRLAAVKSSDLSLHAKNQSLEFDFSKLSLVTQQELVRDRVDLDFEPAQKFHYELLPRFKIFKIPRKHQKSRHNL